jgi:2-amino-4-hydroxy-6-hydroxymethyldihydropteridine diphosphokinase
LAAKIKNMIIIGIGSNLPSISYGSPIMNCETSLDLIARNGVDIVSRSSWYETVPIPVSDQPNFINGVIGVETKLSSSKLLAFLHEIEGQLGRERSVKDAARIIDLDLIAYHDEVVESESLTLPHPRMTARAFVAGPLAEIAPEWHHPISGLSILEILSNLSDQQIKLVSA